MSNEPTIIDSDWISIHVIKNELSRLFKSKEWIYEEVREWSMNVETLYCIRVDLMPTFVKVKLPVVNKMFRKPCNLYRLLDVYSDDSNSHSLVNNDPMKIPFWIPLPDNYASDYVYINYVGTMIDLETGQVLINRDHKMACVYYCATMAFLDDMLNAKFAPQAYAILEQKWSAEAYNAQSVSAYRHMQRQDFKNQSIIQGNLIPRIGDINLFTDSMGE